MFILATGFEPFTGVPSNPTSRLVSLLPSRVGGVRVDTDVLPVDTRAAPEALRAHWARRPAAALHLGVAAERSLISLETQAVNRLRFTVPDNRGRQVIDAPIEPDGPPVIPSRLPLERIAERLRREAIPHELSPSAGEFLCNQVMYASLRGLDAYVPAGFVHVPPDEELQRARSNPAGLPLSVQVRAIELIIQTLVDDLVTSTSSPA